MQPHKIVSEQEWIAARKALLAREKTFTHARDELSAERRELPWVKVEKNYMFDGPNGKETLADLLSSNGSDFNRDYHVSFTKEDIADGNRMYNYEADGKTTAGEAPGVSVFYKDERGDIFHTYSSYARGGDLLIGAYNYLDLMPKGRNEGGELKGWVRRHDEYER
jgi:predicted dithiol-disulfide oxidoreductase (DUF899 family)